MFILFLFKVTDDKCSLPIKSANYSFSFCSWQKGLNNGAKEKI
jgi:hypothetical protein